MTKHFGVSHMEAGQAITPDDIKSAMKTQGISINEGDIILFYTGWTDAKLKAILKHGYQVNQELIMQQWSI